MLIIDEHVEAKLVKALEAARLRGPQAGRLLHFHPAVSPEALRLAVVASVGRHVADDHAEIYLCEDGDIFILAPTLPVKDAKRVMLDVAEALGVAANDRLAELLEIELDAHRLLTRFERKEMDQRAAQEAKQRELDAQQADRKRQQILDKARQWKPGIDLAAKRRERHTPEFMIIEDDAFSRRLVENVLQKRYRLTALADANDALDTYARLAPDLLFLDIDLPDVTGHELLERIMAIDPDAYVVMISGNADRDNVLAAMRLGAKGFVAKPFNRDKIFQYIAQCPTLQH